MACFLVPTAEAIAVTIVTKVAKTKEPTAPEAGIGSGDTVIKAHIPFVRKLKWLTNLLWGGSALLAFEHVWHGEVVPWFPFLTAAGNPQDTASMLHEMATVGVSMAVLVTAVWACMLIVSNAMEKQALNNAPHTTPAAN